MEFLHPTIEAIRLAFADARAYVADPARADVPMQAMQAMLSKEYAAERRKLIKSDAAMELATAGELPGASDTVYLCAVDGDGNACSFINSNYEGFGSCIVPRDCGFSLQNRGAGFALEPGHPERARGRQASVSHDHAGDADAARWLAVRGVRRDGRLEPAAGPHAGRDQPDRPRDGPAGGDR